MAPLVRAEIPEHRIAALEPAELAVFRTPEAAQTPKQRSVARSVAEKLVVTPHAIALQIADPQHAAGHETGRQDRRPGQGERHDRPEPPDRQFRLLEAPRPKSSRPRTCATPGSSSSRPIERSRKADPQGRQNRLRPRVCRLAQGARSLPAVERQPHHARRHHGRDQAVSTNFSSNATSPSPSRSSFRTSWTSPSGSSGSSGRDWGIGETPLDCAGRGTQRDPVPPSWG